MDLSSQSKSILLAQVEKDLGGPLQGIGPLGTFGTDLNTALQLFFKVLSAVVGIMTISAAIWFVFQFFIGAIQIMTSGGDKAKMQEASGRLTQAIIGLVVVIGAIFFISLLGSLMGLNILGPWEFVTNLWQN